MEKLEHGKEKIEKEELTASLFQLLHKTDDEEVTQADRVDLCDDVG